MRIGLSTYALAWSIGVPGHHPEEPLTVIEVLHLAASLGAECIQIADNIPLDKYDEQMLSLIKGTAEKLALPIEVGMRGLTLEAVHRYLHLADYFSSPILRVVIDRTPYFPDQKEVLSTIHQVLPTLQRKNIRLAIENHDRFSSHELVSLVEESDREWIGICLDSVNSLGSGEGFASVSKTLMPYTINLHIKDYKIVRKNHQMGFDIIGTPAGMGLLPIPHLLTELSRHGRCQSALLELWPRPEEHLTDTINKERLWLRESMQYLLKLKQQTMSFR